MLRAQLVALSQLRSFKIKCSVRAICVNAYTIHCISCQWYFIMFFSGVVTGVGLLSATVFVLSGIAAVVQCGATVSPPPPTETNLPTPPPPQQQPFTLPPPAPQSTQTPSPPATSVSALLDIFSIIGGEPHYTSSIAALRCR